MEASSQQQHKTGTLALFAECWSARRTTTRLDYFFPQQTASPYFICSLVQSIRYTQDIRYQHKILHCWLSVTSRLSEVASLIVKVIVMATSIFLSEAVSFLSKNHSASVHGSFKHTETM